MANRNRPAARNVSSTHSSGVPMFEQLEPRLLLSGNYSFSLPQEVAVGDIPESIASADFNGDGRMDLAVTNNNDDTVSVLYSLAGGGFGDRVDVAVGDSPNFVVAGDFDGDGLADLAVTYTEASAEDSVSVVYGLVGGGFGNRHDAFVGNYSTGGIALADFNGDGRADLAFADQGSSAVVVLYGRAGGGLDEGQQDVVVGNGASGIIAADFNGDGLDDMAVTNTDDHTVSVQYGLLAGGFGNPETLAVGDSPNFIVAGDFNGDGRVDLAVSYTGASDEDSITVLYGLVGGGFGDRQDTDMGNYSTGGIATADFNGDGLADLAFADQPSSAVVVLFGLPGGGLGDWQQDMVAGNWPNGIVSADFNADGRADLAIANGLDDTVSVFYGLFLGTPTPEDDSVTTPQDTPVGTADVLANDTDPDGDTLSIVSFTQGSHGTVDHHGGGSFTYTPDAGWNGSDSFDYTVIDGNGGWATATVNVTVTPVEHAPVAEDDSLTTAEDTPATTGNVLTNDSDADGDPLSIVSFTQGTHGTVANNGDGTFTYTPDADWNGSDSFGYTISDGNGGQATATVNVAVTPVDDVPVAQDGSLGFQITSGQTVKYVDADGTAVSVKLKYGSADLRFTGDDFGLTATKSGWTVSGSSVLLEDIALSDTTSRSSLTFKTNRGGDRLATVGSITGSTPLKKLSGKKVILIGDGIVLTGSGYIGSVYLHSLTNDADIIMDGTAAPKGVSIKITESMMGGTDIILGSYLKSLSAKNWMEFQGSPSLVTPWASKIAIKYELGADLLFTGANPKNGVTLYKLSVGNAITDSVIIALFGSVGTISAGQWDAGSLNATWAKTIMIKGKRGSLPGNFGATVTLTGQNSRGISLNKLQVAGEILGSHITLNGGAGTIKAGQWNAGSLNAGWVKTIMIKGKRGSLDGNFGADLSLTGVNAPKGYAFKTIKVAGEASGTWAVTGNGSTVQLGASSADWTATINGSGNVKYLKVKGYKDQFGNKVQGDLAGSWTGNSVRSVLVYGNLYDAQITLNQVPDLKNLALRSLTVKGWIGDDTLGTQTWILTNGNIGSIKAGGIRNSSIIAANNAAGYSQDVQSPLGGIAGDGVLDLLDASELVGDGTRIKSLKITGIKGQSGKFVINSTIAATEFGTVSLRFLDTINGSPFGISADYIGKLTIKDDIGTDTWKWLETASDSLVFDDAEIRLV